MSEVDSESKWRKEAAITKGTRCPGCKEQVDLPHHCKRGGVPFTLADPRAGAATVEELFADDGPKFSSPPEDYDEEKAVVRFGDPHEGLSEDEEHA